VDVGALIYKYDKDVFKPPGIELRDARLYYEVGSPIVANNMKKKTLCRISETFCIVGRKAPVQAVQKFCFARTRRI
jgi:hypothetical protein